MKKNIGLLLLSMTVLGACSPIALLGGAAAGVGVSSAQEGGIERAYDDAVIQTEINDLWFRSNVDMFRKLDLTVTQGRVLITGVVQDPEHRVEAVRLAWQPAGVKQVINEIRVSEETGLLTDAQDTWITTRLRAAITFDENVQSVNYSIDTVQGTVYLMGAAQDQAELDHVIEIARTMDGVQHVVSYVKLTGNQPDPLEWNSTSDN